jgi:putative FmdB family regulatory protein
MPIYEYQCTACGHHFDTIQSFKDEALTHCPVCGEAALKKLISAPAFHLKGTGWYATDFKNPAKPSAGTDQHTSVQKGEEKLKTQEKEPVAESIKETNKEPKSPPLKKVDKAH